MKDIFRVLSIDDDCLYVVPLNFAYGHLFEHHPGNLEVVAGSRRIHLDASFDTKAQRFRGIRVDSNNINASIYKISNRTTIDTPRSDVLTVLSHINKHPAFLWFFERRRDSIA